MHTRNIVSIGLLAAVYVALCAVLQPISFGPIQFRVSEVLCLLCIDYPLAIFGVSIGCFLSNLFLGGLGIIDVIFGTAATVIGCLMAYHFHNVLFKNYPLLSVFCIALANGIIVGIELGFLLDSVKMIPLYMLYVFIGESVVLFVGLPFYRRLYASGFFEKKRRG